MKAKPRPNNRLHVIVAMGTDHPPEAAGGGRRLWALGTVLELRRKPSAGVVAWTAGSRGGDPAGGKDR